MGKKRTKAASAIVELHDPNAVPTGYAEVLSGLTVLITDSRRRAATTVNRELVLLYWQIGSVIRQQQDDGNWGDRIVARLSADLRSTFPELKGLSKDNLFRMQKFVISCEEIDGWISRDMAQGVAATGKANSKAAETKVGTMCQQLPGNISPSIVDTVCPQFVSRQISNLIFDISWSHHRLIIARCDTPAERYFYMKTSASERWSVRELRRQIDAVLFTRYVSVKDEPERCLPANPEAGDLLPFRDHYVLEFLGLEEEHSEKQLRHAILANLRDFFLEFGRDLTFVGEEYPLTVGNDTFAIDLLFFHRRLQCLIVVELKRRQFKPEYAGKSRFYCAALDEQIRLEHETPSLGLVLCKSADAVQVRLALTDAANRIGVATYQTGLPDAALIERRLATFRMEQFPGNEDTST